MSYKTDAESDGSNMDEDISAQKSKSPAQRRLMAIRVSTGKRTKLWLEVCEFEVLEKHEHRLVRGAAAPELRGTMRNSEEEGRG